MPAGAGAGVQKQGVQKKRLRADNRPLAAAERASAPQFLHSRPAAGRRRWGAPTAIANGTFLPQ